MSTAPSRGLHLALWGVQGLLALAFVGAGVMKATTPIPDLAAQMSWVKSSPDALVRFIGISELAGGIGLVLPSALRIQPVLTPVAAALLTVVMVLGVGTHVMLGEGPMAAPAIVLGALSAFVAWGRFTRAPIAAR